MTWHLYTINGEPPTPTLEDMPRVKHVPWDVKVFDAESLVCYMDFFYPDCSNRERSAIASLTHTAYANIVSGKHDLKLPTYHRILWELDQPFGAFLRGVWGDSGGFKLKRG